MSIFDTEIVISMGGSREISCIDISVEIGQLIATDLLNEIIDIYNPNVEEITTKNTF